MTDTEILKTVVKALDSKKAGNIKIIKIGDLTVLANYFVIAEGGNNAVVVKNITEAVQALFDVDTHKIKIMKGG